MRQKKVKELRRRFKAALMHSYSVEGVSLDFLMAMTKHDFRGFKEACGKGTRLRFSRVHKDRSQDDRRTETVCIQ